MLGFLLDEVGDRWSEKNDRAFPFLRITTFWMLPKTTPKLVLLAYKIMASVILQVVTSMSPSSAHLNGTTHLVSVEEV